MADENLARAQPVELRRPGYQYITIDIGTPKEAPGEKRYTLDGRSPFPALNGSGAQLRGGLVLSALPGLQTGQGRW